MFGRHAAALALTFVMGTSGVALSSEFNERFDGEWSGSGQVLREGASSPQNVTCDLAGQGGETGIALSGQCRAMLIFTRDIGVDVAHDPQSGSYEGVYRGSSDGPAQLAGELSGETLNLDVAFASDIHGGSGTMVVRSLGPDRFAMTMVGGDDQQPIADLVFERKS